MALSVRQLLFDVIVIINSITKKLSYSAFDNASDLLSTVVCDTILIDGNYPQHNISHVSLVFSSNLCKKMTTAKPYLCTLVDYCFYFRQTWNIFCGF